MNPPTTSTVPGTTTTVGELATVCRSKNAGPYYTTIDVFLPDRATFDSVVAQQILTTESVAAAYGIAEERVYGIFEMSTALGIKVTILKDRPTDSPTNVDIMGAHQHLPIAWMPVEVV